MSFINICRDNTDPFYRYKMPPIQSKTEGRGNGIKTAIVNLAEVARALNRPPSYLIKFFGYELGAQTQIQNDRYLVNGAHDSNELQDSLDGFINKFVLCGSCKNPETEIVLKGKDSLERDCKACGKITLLDPKHKLYSFIVKNPPDNKKGKKSATATANVVGGGKSISDIASGHSNNNNVDGNDSSNLAGNGVADGAGDDEDDDLLAKKINAEVAQLGDVVEVKDDEWAVDMSQEAIAARARELEGLTLQNNKFDEFGEWLLKESKDSKDDLPSDVEIYKRIVELDIGDSPETLQVLGQVLFDEDIINQIEPHAGLLAKLINNDDEFEKSLLGGLERFFGLEKPKKC
ncbi:Eukaryotic translation initiation factor eIF-5, putative [Candida maltosa Xu316]|uniref:Eukaryotic translation initiation factor eIF-5, putative n=1 Tax=Candida maltosa (strain Xu316) TaxID=1245528 RepID=M3J778_CANMX|nr:Eukaryotic translation initiation factor eIF-5, putative [Candida maltosa Xu316]